MRETMRDAGVGLAAPQIGLSLQLAVNENREGSAASGTCGQRSQAPTLPRDHQSSDHFDRRRRSVLLRRLPQPRWIFRGRWTNKERVSLSGSIWMVCPDLAT